MLLKISRGFEGNFDESFTDQDRRPAPRYMQPLTKYVVPASVEIKAETLGKPGSEMDVVSIYRKRSDRGNTLTDDTFKSVLA